LLALGFHFTAWFVLSFLTVSAKSQRFVNAIIEVTRDLQKLRELSAFALWCNQKAKSISILFFLFGCCRFPSEKRVLSATSMIFNLWS